MQMVTKSQLKMLISAWGIVADIPKKGVDVIVCWPGNGLPTARLSWTTKKGTYGDRLYSVSFGD